MNRKEESLGNCPKLSDDGMLVYKIASISSRKEKGIVVGAKRLMIFPFLSTKNFVKFHLMVSPIIPFASLVNN